MKKSSSESQKATEHSGDSNIYDIICYYNEGDDEPQHVNEVIKHIEKAHHPIDDDKWIKWKLFGCLLINVLLSAPINSYGTIYLQQKEAFDEHPSIIWPPIVFNSVYLLVTPWLFNSISTPASRNSRTNRVESSIFSKLTNKSVIVVFSMILATGVSIAGFAFTYLQANFVMILIFYSIIGGKRRRGCKLMEKPGFRFVHPESEEIPQIFPSVCTIRSNLPRTESLIFTFCLIVGCSSCIIMGKLFVLINGILNNDRLHLINFIYSFGQALTQLLFPFLIQMLTRFVCYNCALLVIGATMFNIVPITLLIVKNKLSIKLRHKGSVKDRTPVEGNEESRYSDLSAITFDFGVDIKYPSDVYDMENKWKNPAAFGSDSEKDEKCDNFLEELESHRRMNSEGVEILQTILEGDEDMEIKSPEWVAIIENELSSDAIESIYEEINRKHEQQLNGEPKRSICNTGRDKITKCFHNACTLAHRQVINPLRRSLKIFKFYPSVILKSCDIFSYLLFITLILPNLALKLYRFEERGRVVYLITLMGFCWIAYALLVLKFHNRLKQNFIHYFHIVGLLGKFFGYLFTNQRYSFNGFVFGLILISIGHANSFHLQEIMIRNCFHPRKWFYVRGSIYSFSGFLILIYCIIFHVLYVTLTFVTFCNIFVLFNLTGIVVWLLTHYKYLIYIFTRY